MHNYFFTVLNSSRMKIIQQRDQFWLLRHILVRIAKMELSKIGYKNSVRTQKPILDSIYTKKQHLKFIILIRTCFFISTSVKYDIHSCNWMTDEIRFEISLSFWIRSFLGEWNLHGKSYFFIQMKDIKKWDHSIEAFDDTFGYSSTT